MNVVMPNALTAENGAKAELSGEFFERYDATDEQMTLNPDLGETIRVDIPVRWTTIKAIYKRCVKLFASPPLVAACDGLARHTDMWPWYWIAYGEKCYAFATVSAFPVDESKAFPTPGTRLDPHETNREWWIGENGTEMIIDATIATQENQQGDTICEFIAMSHAEIMKGRIYVGEAPQGTQSNPQPA